MRSGSIGSTASRDSPCGRSGGRSWRVGRGCPLSWPTRPNERWSMDFVGARLANGRWFRTLTVLDLYTRESLAPVAYRSLTGVKVAAALTHVLRHRSSPTAITVDNGTS